jgi:hypothetical protein
MNKEKVELDEWKVTEKRFVSYIDIMGFKDRVSRSTHDQIYSMMQKIVKGKTMYENIIWGNESTKLIKSTNYSDSIMLYSKDSEYNSLRSIICTISALSNYLLSEGIPFKGAVAYGTMTLDYNNSIFFGQPLIDAYLLQEELYFYGIVIHATAEEQIDLKSIKTLISNYLCPFKNGNSNHLTVFPAFSKTSDSKYKEQRDKLFNSIKIFRYNTSGHLRKYIDNTDAYLKFISTS